MSKMLVVVDYQNDFVNGTLAVPGAEQFDHRIAALVRSYQKNGDIIIVTMDTHPKTYLETREGRALPIEHCIRGSDGQQLYGETGKVLSSIPVDNMLLLTKGTFGVSPGDMCVFVGRHPDVTEIRFVGLVTNMCVIANVCCFQAMYPEAQMVVDATLCASVDKDLHEKALDVMEGMQVKVLRKEDEGE